ncbi:ATP-binding cassette domain-containing protein, partial [Mesorhizobium sp. M8A.F.Ca.ET.181.01.1.1]|uniref:ATP-binding cassette domain-containing protein n=1 Tax=Mesorhizobium sp. M8A.F.Ca.ET.181.01.1.1 TaxID=2563963 RepID=UPI0010940734
ETRNLSGKGFENVSLTVRAGEIVGLYGLIGAGRSEFVTTLYGRHRKSGGQIMWEGKEVQVNSEHDAIRLGMALAPESRRDQGLCLNLPVGLNLNL